MSYLKQIKLKTMPSSAAKGQNSVATLTDNDLAASPFPHFRHPILRSQHHTAVTLLGDAAHTMPPILAQGTNQALLDTMVLCKALADFQKEANSGIGDLSRVLRRYEKSARKGKFQLLEEDRLFNPSRETVRLIARVEKIAALESRSREEPVL